jgi:hypothetical protein
MTRLSVKLTIKELELLTSLASDQLFRREFIEPKLPGHKAIAGELSMGKILVARLQSLLKSGAVKKVSAASPGRNGG